MLTLFMPDTVVHDHEWKFSSLNPAKPPSRDMPKLTRNEIQRHETELIFRISSWLLDAQCGPEICRGINFIALLVHLGSQTVT